MEISSTQIVNFDLSFEATTWYFDFERSSDLQWFNISQNIPEGNSKKSSWLGWVLDLGRFSLNLLWWWLVNCNRLLLLLPTRQSSVEVLDTVLTALSSVAAKNWWCSLWGLANQGIKPGLLLCKLIILFSLISRIFLFVKNVRPSSFEGKARLTGNSVKF